MTSAHEAVALRFREDWGRLVAGLIGWCGDWDLAEECAAEAFTEAVPAWERSGVPDAPLAWLTTVARNRARDRMRRRTTEDAKLALSAADATDVVAPVDDEDIPDERLRLIFTCCHPALPMPARVALTLRTLCGLTAAEIGRAFLVTEPTMEKRLVRARAKIKHAGIPYGVPPPEHWAERVEGVLSVLYLMFNEGYAASSGESLLRVDVSAEAIRLTRSLVDLLPAEAEVRGLLALMLLTDARRPARVREGRVVSLAEQDRSRWDQDRIAEGARLLDAEPPWGPYAVQARIALCHDVAARPEDTDWATIAELYTQLPATPVIELNRAVAVSMAHGPEAALPLVEALRSDLGDYYLHAATLADLYARLGRVDEAAAALATAIGQAPTGAERRLLRERRDALINES
ncbi:MAG TPA: sigma-70 family RNA polymerase sigma factor [Nocardioides sp.]|uniref:RNA polymerase sigma factor n=1 Tax=Nocardioides sp. TaxID=35761 RepID=UPI002F3F8E70